MSRYKINLTFNKPDLRIYSPLFTSFLRKMCKVVCFIIRFLCIIFIVGVLAGTLMYFILAIGLFVVVLLV